MISGRTIDLLLYMLFLHRRTLGYRIWENQSAHGFVIMFNRLDYSGLYVLSRNAPDYLLHVLHNVKKTGAIEPEDYSDMLQAVYDISAKFQVKKQKYIGLCCCCKKEFEREKMVHDRDGYILCEKCFAKRIVASTPQRF